MQFLLKKRPELERTIEARFVRKAKALGFVCVKMNIQGRRSFPDRMVLGPGGFIAFFEFKRPGLGKLTAGQVSTIRQLRKLGFKVYVSESAEESIHVLQQS